MNSNNIDSKIREQFQAKFNDFQSPPPADGWERLETSLDATKIVPLHSTTRPWWYAASVAATVALLVGSALWLRNSNEQQVAETEIAYIPTVKTEEIEENQAEEPVLLPIETLVAENIPQRQRQQERVNEYVPTPETPIIDITYVNEEPTAPPPQNDANDFQLSEEVILVAGISDATINELPQFRRRRDNLSVAVGSRSGVAPFHTAVNTPMTLRSAAVAVPDEESVLFFDNEGSAADNESEKFHNQPVSFGITVSMPLARNLSIETGLVYTYLSSRVQNTSLNSHEREIQRLHYLGIPLNINYTVLNLNNLNLFVSVGGMVERDIYGTFRSYKERVPVHTIAGESGTITSRERVVTPIRQDNPQFSVNAGVGASYPIHNRLRLYGRIGGAYYFDARNPHRTIYSDGRIVMNLNLGIRYEF